MYSTKHSRIQGRRHTKGQRKNLWEILTHFLEKVEQRIKGERSLGKKLDLTKKFTTGPPTLLMGKCMTHYRVSEVKWKPIFSAWLQNFNVMAPPYPNELSRGWPLLYVTTKLRDTLWWEIPRLTPAAHSKAWRETDETDIFISSGAFHYSSNNTMICQFNSRKSEEDRSASRGGRYTL